jgi:AAA+ ATPase superfamily predicted ATPase
MPKKKPPLAVRKLTKHELENKVQDILDELDTLWYEMTDGEYKMLDEGI